MSQKNLLGVPNRSKQPKTARAKYLAAVAVGAVVVIGGAGKAQAVPSYAYATLQFTDFALSGVIAANGTPLTGVTNFTSAVTITDGANYPGSPAGGNSAAGTLTAGADPAQATSGPGGFPGANVFTQALNGGQNGTRGDAQISGALATGATSNLVAEGNLALFGASAGSNAGSSTTLKATFTATANLTINLSFKALATIIGSVGALGDSSNPQTSAQYTIVDTTTGVIVRFAQPAALNKGQSTTDPASSISDIGSFASFSFTDTLTAGDSYQITLADSVTEILSTAAPVPEPASLAVLGLGLMGLARVVRRKKA